MQLQFLPLVGLQPHPKRPGPIFWLLGHACQEYHGALHSDEHLIFSRFLGGQVSLPLFLHRNAMLRFPTLIQRILQGHTIPEFIPLYKQAKDTIRRPEHVQDTFEGSSRAEMMCH